MAQSNRLLRPIRLTARSPLPPPPPPITYRILNENGSRLLTQSGAFLRKEQSD